MLKIIMAYKDHLPLSFETPGNSLLDYRLSFIKFRHSLRVVETNSDGGQNGPEWITDDRHDI